MRSVSRRLIAALMVAALSLTAAPAASAQTPSLSGGAAYQQTGRKPDSAVLRTAQTAPSKKATKSETPAEKVALAPFGQSPIPVVPQPLHPQSVDVV